MHSFPFVEGVSFVLTTERIPPAPLHSLVWQSPAIVSVTGVNSARGVKPQIPPVMQTGTWQALPVGQFASAMQPTQAPSPSHIWLVPHETPAETLVFTGIPLLQVSLVHGLLSPGTSLSSFTVATAPLEHTSFLQSPGVSETVIPSF